MPLAHAAAARACPYGKAAKPVQISNPSGYRRDNTRTNLGAFCSETWPKEQAHRLTQARIFIP
ncbi:hypothetical protein TW79_04345 [Tritonibacter mobilis]|nr:hypothetical protein TW79_04345 [Tritonibacter mobilis]